MTKLKNFSFKISQNCFDKIQFFFPSNLRTPKLSGGLTLDFEVFFPFFCKKANSRLTHKSNILFPNKFSFRIKLRLNKIWSYRLKLEWCLNNWAGVCLWNFHIVFQSWYFFVNITFTITFCAKKCWNQLKKNNFVIKRTKILLTSFLRFELMQ